MTHDLQDRLLAWLHSQRIGLQPTKSEFDKGRLALLLDVEAFVLTDGKLDEPTLKFDINSFTEQDFQTKDEFINKNTDTKLKD